MFVNSDDQEAFGAGIRAAFEIKVSITGPSAPVQPCNGGSDCEDTCADYFGNLEDASSPNSVVFPKWIESAVDTMSDRELGQRFKRAIISPHHFAGTASVGKVVNSDLKVIGVEGLFIADASILPRTPRVNTMASVVMVGHLAGMAFN